ncbi:SGS-domain-containing protein [Cryphonectria parasitica EP155]|uniref:SGS-domain-containing protein n=1 Tax=Cryphonectria parasitica (strain ATCC 38755 / EP155) TaxID=660469 RepID=A0A9P4YDI8_CRYP1|nr:SGS-domain-containing protein [Cryphonectria parasitica EP155]KAF3771391.1 SGS-domain-containing protein [Cryphonectria parasitica EP155]
MSAVKYAETGMAAAQAHKWDEAITNLNKAIDQSKSPQWLLSRSQAFMETGNLDKALRDADFAYCTAAERGNDKSRKQMIDAQHRRSVIYFRKKLYANADACASWSQQLAKGVAVKAADKTADNTDDKGFYHITAADIEPRRDTAPGQGQHDGGAGRFAQVSSLLGGSKGSSGPYEQEWARTQSWRTTIIRFLEALPAEDPARRVTAKPVPAKPSLEEEEGEYVQKPDPEIEAAKASPAEVRSKPELSNGPFRSQMYQSDASITISLFMKFASKEDTAKVQVELQPNLITVTGVPREPSTAYIVPHAAINPAKSTYRVATMKIEFNLAKAQPGKWPSFGREELSQPGPSTLPQADETAIHTTLGSNTAAAQASTPKEPPKPKAPVYPTSAKGGPKDWDHISADDDEKDVDAFFKQLYKDATPDQQRAMMKSFQESNGTTLSTDWATVSKETVKTNPPEGVVAKKWSS